MDYSALHNPEAARELYYQLVEQNPEDILRVQRRLLESTSREITRLLTYLEQNPHDTERQQLIEDLRPARAKKARQLAVINTLERVVAGAQETVHGSLDLFGEFDQLLSLPGIDAIGTESGKLIVIVKIRMEHRGVRYDMGDWKIITGDLGFRTIMLRSGRLSSWPMAIAPCHIVNGNQFCFGRNKTIIRDNASRRQYVQAIRVAIHCMTTENPKNLSSLPMAFAVATD